MERSTPSFRQAFPWVCFIAYLFMVSYCGRGVLSPLFPYIEADFGIGHAQATTLLLMQGFGMSISQAASAFILSKVKPRNMAAISLCFSGLCFLVVQFAPGLNSMRMGFFVFGLTAGLYFAAGMSTLGSLVSHQDWGKAVGIHELAPNLGFVLLPLIAQSLLALTTWRGVIGLWGLLMLLTGIAFARFGHGGQEYCEAPSRDGSKELLRHPTLWMFMFIMVIALVGEYAIYSILTLHLVQSFNIEPDRANFFLSLSRITAPFMVILGGWASDVLPVRRFLTFSFALHTVALGMMGLPSFPIAMAGMLLQSTAIALAFPGIFKLIGECYPGSKQPLVLSFVMPASGLFGTGIAPNLLGFAGQTIGFGPAMFILAAFCLACIPMLHSVRRLPDSASSAPPLY